MDASASGVAVVDEATGAFSLAAAQFRVETSGEFDETTPRDIIPPNVLGVNVLFENGPGNFGPSLLDGGDGGSMGAPGCFDFHGDDSVPFVLPLIPDSLGAGGSDSASSLGGLVTTTLVGDPCRTGTATVDDIAVGDMLGQSISRAGFDMRASDWTAALRMVAPARATINSGALRRGRAHLRHPGCHVRP